MTTGLVLASQWGLMPLVEHLLSKGADVDEEESFRATALIAPLMKALSILCSCY